jgi:hypothetical protein
LEGPALERVRGKNPSDLWRYIAQRVDPRVMKKPPMGDTGDTQNKMSKFARKKRKFSVSITAYLCRIILNKDLAIPKRIAYLAMRYRKTICYAQMKQQACTLLHKLFDFSRQTFLPPWEDCRGKTRAKDPIRAESARDGFKSSQWDV